MAKHTYEVQTCACCDRPIDCSPNIRSKISLQPMMGVLVTVGYSEGGWGRRRNHVNYSAEVCKECYEHIVGLCRPVIDFLQNPRKRAGDNVPPVRGHELEHERR